MDNKAKKKIPWQMILMLLLIAVICVIGMEILFYHEDRLLAEEDQSLLLSLLGCFGALFAQVVLHETGHLVFGLLSGYKFVSFRIMSFMWIKKNGKIRFRRFSLAGTGGQCLMDPPDFIDGKIPVVLMNLGGVLMNIITGLLCLGLTFVFVSIPYLSFTFLAMMLFGILFALSNGIPLHTGTVDNDGYNALCLSRSPDAARALWIQLKINERNTNDVRLKDMPEEWFAVPEDAEMKNSLIASVGVFACNRLMDEHRFDEADALMAHLLETDSVIPGIYRGLLVCDRIFVELIRENRREVIEGLLTKNQISFMKSMKNFPSVLRTQYAYALLYAGNSANADGFISQFEKCAKGYPYPAEILTERELIEIADRKKREGTVQ